MLVCELLFFTTPEVLQHGYHVRCRSFLLPRSKHKGFLWEHLLVNKVGGSCSISYQTKSEVPIASLPRSFGMPTKIAGMFTKIIWHAYQDHLACLPRLLACSPRSFGMVRISPQIKLEVWEHLSTNKVTGLRISLNKQSWRCKNISQQLKLKVLITFLNKQSRQVPIASRNEPSWRFEHISQPTKLEVPIVSLNKQSWRFKNLSQQTKSEVPIASLNKQGWKCENIY